MYMNDFRYKPHLIFFHEKDILTRSTTPRKLLVQHPYEELAL